MILESDEDIEWMINRFDGLIVKLKEKNPNSALFKEILKFNNDIVSPWYERYKFLRQEIEEYEDSEMKNQILDLSNRILKEL